MNRRTLGDLVRSRRDLADPVSRGFSPSGRRTPGLRREEVAALAHISVEHYTNIERGRGARPSSDVLAAVCDALGLDDTDRDLVFELGGHASPRPHAPSTEVAPSIRALMDSLPTTAGLLMSARSDPLAWNDAAVRLLGDLAAVPVEERNLARRHFLSGPPPDVVRYDAESGAAYSRVAVAQLHATSARYPDDPETLRLVSDLRGGSAEFERLWRGRRTRILPHTTKVMLHPLLGTLHLTCDLLLVPDRDQHLVLLTAEPGTPAAEVLGGPS